MTLDDITLVQQSFSRITRIREEAARIFYADLFATAPEVRPYFASTDMSKQGVKLLATLAVVVAGLNDLGAVLNTARKLARNHLDYGVQAEDYAKDNGLDYVVVDPNKRAANVRPRGYGENFATDRHAPWTH